MNGVADSHGLDRLWACLLAALVIGGAAAGPAGAGGYEEGESVVFSGVVTDRDGEPLENVRVVVEATQSSFSITKLGRTEKGERQLATTTDVDGQYAIVWPWDNRFNHFELVVGFPVRENDGEHFHRLSSGDLSKRVTSGSPVVTTVVVEDRSYLDTMRQFLASIETDEQQRIYDQAGKPDRVQRVEYPDHLETSWWYFRSGRAYHFRDGKLERVVPFEPVEPF